jgi:hypothetical protein
VRKKNRNGGDWLCAVLDANQDYVMEFGMQATFVLRMSTVMLAETLEGLQQTTQLKPNSRFYTLDTGHTSLRRRINVERRT